MNRTATRRQSTDWLELEDSVNQAIALLDLLITLTADTRQTDGGKNADSIAVGIQHLGWQTMDRLKRSAESVHSSQQTALKS